MIRTSEKINMAASLFFYAWLIGLAYFSYHIFKIEAEPYLQWSVLRYTHEHVDYQEAILFLISGIVALAFLSFFGFFAFKFLYNIIFGKFLSQHQILIKPIMLIILLALAFYFVQPIKTAALTGYAQVSVLFQIVNSYDSDKHPSAVKMKKLTDTVDEKIEE